MASDDEKKILSAEEVAALISLARYGLPVIGTHLRYGGGESLYLLPLFIDKWRMTGAHERMTQKDRTENESLDELAVRDFLAYLPLFPLVHRLPRTIEQNAQLGCGEAEPASLRGKPLGTESRNGGSAAFGRRHPLDGTVPRDLGG